MPHAHYSVEAHCDVAAELRQALKFARSNKVVAEWLFASQQASFHPSSHILHPSAFSKSHATVWTQTFDLLHSYPDAAQPVPYLSATSSTTLYVPAQTLKNIILGYTFTAVISETDIPIECISANTLRKGRFAYNPSSKSLLLYINFTQTMDSLISITNPSPAPRQIRYFVVPHRPTHPYVLPSTVVTCMLFTSDQQCKQPHYLTISPILPVDHSALAPDPSQPASADPFSSSEEPLLNAQHRKHFWATRAPSTYVSGVWDRQHIPQLPRCVLDDLTLPPASPQTSSFRTQHVHQQPSTSWLPSHEVRLLKRMNIKRSLRPKGSVLFDMSSINSSGKPTQPTPEKRPSSHTDRSRIVSQPSMSVDNFSWSLDCDTNSSSDVEDDVDDGERDALDTSSVVHMLEGSFTSFNAIRQEFDTSTPRLIKTEIYHAKSVTERSRSEELRRFRQTAACIYYNSLLWHSKNNPTANEEEMAVSKWLFAVEMKSSPGQNPECREDWRGKVMRFSSDTTFSSSSVLSVEASDSCPRRARTVD